MKIKEKIIIKNFIKVIKEADKIMIKNQLGHY